MVIIARNTRGETSAVCIPLESSVIEIRSSDVFPLGNGYKDTIYCLVAYRSPNYWELGRYETEEEAIKEFNKIIKAFKKGDKYYEITKNKE
jgi:hypothetical protein